MSFADNMHRIRVRISEMKVAKGDAVLVSHGLGSCVGVAVYDNEAEVGGLAHILLPGSPRPQDNPMKFSDTAIVRLVEELLEMGASRGNLRAKVVGGSNMFSWITPEGKKTIGERNVEAVTSKLGELDIGIVATDVGGSHGRTVEFLASRGEMTVRNAQGDEKQI